MARVIAAILLLLTLAAHASPTSARASIFGISLGDTCANDIRARGRPNSLTLGPGDSFVCTWQEAMVAYSSARRATLVRGTSLYVEGHAMPAGTSMHQLEQSLGPPAVRGPVAAHWKALGLSVLLDDHHASMFILSNETRTATVSAEYLPDLHSFPVLNFENVFPGLAEGIARKRAAADLRMRFADGYVIAVSGPHLATDLQHGDYASVAVSEHDAVGRLPAYLKLRDNGGTLVNPELGLRIGIRGGHVTAIELTMPQRQQTLFETLMKRVTRPVTR